MISSGRRAAAAILLALMAIAVRSNEAAAAPPCRPQLFEGSTFLVCVADIQRSRISLALSDKSGVPLRSFSRLADALGPSARHVRFAMNAGMFTVSGEPVGLYIEATKQGHPINLATGPGNFYMKPNGVFWQDSSGALHIDPSDTFAQRSRHAVWATQSGPLLLSDGKAHPAISYDGTSTNTRNGVGLRNSREAVFVIANEPVSFGRFLRFFRDFLGCRDALYLDGAVSSMWVPETGRLDHDYPLGPMLVVLDKPN